MGISENFKDEYDYLTQILNRRSGEYRIIEQLSKGEGALLVIDLDNFKLVNDTFGHLMGDHVLKQVADILKIQEKNHIVSRMAGDEFILFLRDVVCAEDVVKIVDSIMDTFSERCAKDDILAHTSLSIGIAFTTQEGKNYKQLFRCADRAMYYVKQNGKGGYSFYNSEESKCDNSTRIDLERLVNSIRHVNGAKGAYRVEYQQFIKISEFVENFTKRNHQGLQIVLLTIDFDRSIPMELEERDDLMRDLELSVAKALRSVDVCTRFSSSQMLLLLVDTSVSYVAPTVQRVLGQFYDLHNPSEIKVVYETEDLFSL